MLGVEALGVFALGQAEPWTNNPDPTNASYMQIGMFNNEAKLISSSLGSGTNYPLTITTGGSERARLDTNGVFMVNTTALGGLTGLGGLSFKAALNGDVMLGTFGRNVATSRSIGVFTTDDPASDDRARITFTTVAGGSSSNSRILFSTNTYGVSGGERMRIDEIGNVGIGATSFGTSAAGVLAIKNGTEPSTGPADTVQFYSVDRSAGNTIPAIWCEGSGVTNAGITSTAVTHKIALKVNGTVYYLLATTNAT